MGVPVGVGGAHSLAWPPSLRATSLLRGRFCRGALLLLPLRRKRLL